jgi:hypothetical protein
MGHHLAPSGLDLEVIRKISAKYLMSGTSIKKQLKPPHGILNLKLKWPGLGLDLNFIIEHVCNKEPTSYDGAV